MPLYIAHVILPYNIMLVNSTFVLMLFVTDVPTLNKVLSYLIMVQFLDNASENRPPTPKSIPEKNRYPAFIDFCVGKAGVVCRR